jgi:hypothetical protein
MSVSRQFIIQPLSHFGMLFQESTRIIATLSDLLTLIT